MAFVRLVLRLCGQAVLLQYSEATLPAPFDRRIQAISQQFDKATARGETKSTVMVVVEVEPTTDEVPSYKLEEHVVDFQLSTQCVVLLHP
jgi:hypothetical protein